MKALSQFIVQSIDSVIPFSIHFPISKSSRFHQSVLSGNPSYLIENIRYQNFLLQHGLTSTWSLKPYSSTYLPQFHHHRTTFYGSHGPSCPSSSGQTPEMNSPSSTCAGEGPEPSVAWCRCHPIPWHPSKGTSFPW